MMGGTFAERLQETAAEESASLGVEEGDQISIRPDGVSRTGFDVSANADITEGELASGPLDSRRDAGATGEGVEGFRTPGEAANISELLKFVFDRTGYIRQLETEDTPESNSRVENLRELVNAAMDSRDRGETLSEFLDHAALVSDADGDDGQQAKITSMTSHAAKGLEFPLVFLCGLEEGLFPHSRTLLAPDDIEEERRLAYVGMTRAMDTLVLTRAVYRRRYGTDMPEASVPSRFLEEVPTELLDST